MNERAFHSLALGPSLMLLLVFGLGRPAMAAQISVYFDRDDTKSSAQVQPQQQFQYYIAASDIGGNLWAFECEVLIPPEITVTGRVPEFDRSIDIGDGLDNWIMGLGLAVPVYDRVNLIEYTALLLTSAEGLRIELGPARNSDSPAMPRYVTGEFSEEVVYEFDEANGGIINADVQSWGRLKSQYGGQ